MLRSLAGGERQEPNVSLEWLEHTAGVEEIRELAFRNWRAL